MRPTRKSALLILCALIYLFFRGIGDHGLLDPVEGINASVALNMVARKNIFVPMADNLPWLGSKTMGFWWLSALALKLFGWVEFSARFWSAAAATGAAVAAWFAARTIKDERAANYAAVITAGTVPVWVVSQIASSHALYTFCVTLALTGALGAFRDKRFFLLLHTGSILAFIVQGPCGLILPWLAFSFYCLYDRRENLLSAALLYPPGLGVTVFLGSGYLLLLYAKNPALLVLMRFNPPAPALSSLSWTLFVTLALLCPWGGFFAETLTHIRPARDESETALPRSDLTLIAWGGVFLIFGFLSGDALLVTAALPSLAVLSGVCLSQAVEEGNINVFRRAILYEILFMIPFLPVCIFWVRSHGAGVDYWSAGIRATLPSVVPWIFFCVLFLFAGWYYTRTRQPKKLMLHSCLTSLLCLLPLAGAFDLTAGETSVRDAGIFLRNEMQEQDVLVQYAVNYPSLYFYTAHPSSLLFISPTPGVMGQEAENELYLRFVWNETARVFLLIEKHQQVRTPPLQEVYNLKEARRLVILSNRKTRHAAPSLTLAEPN